MKSNPLFFDSTKFRGDAVVVEIELRGVDLAFGESLYVNIVPEANETIFAQLRPKSLRKWSVQARLGYQQSARISFHVLRGDDLVEVSDERSIKASYIIPQVWDRSPKESAGIESPFQPPSNKIEGGAELKTPLENETSALPEVPLSDIPVIPKNEPNLRLPMVIDSKNSLFQNDNLKTRLDIDELL